MAEGVDAQVEGLLDDVPDSPRYLNRELSWLDFNERVLALGADEAVPLLERAKFLAIFSENLDEFFQVRVAGLEGAGLRRAGRGLTRRTDPGPAAHRGARASGGAGRAPAAPLPRRDRAGPRGQRRAAVALGRPRRGRREVPRGDLRAADLPGAHAARRRPRSPLPLHLEPLAEPGGAPPRPGHGGAAVRPRQGAGPAAALRGHARWRAVRAPGAGDRGTPGTAVPRDGCGVHRHVPREPQRRPHPRGGGGRGPPRRRGDRAASPSVRPGGAPRDQRPT